MKKTITILITLILFSLPVFSQSRAISRKSKILTPFVTSNKDTLKVGDNITLLLGTKPDGGFKYVQLLNYMNEPIQPASSRMAMRKSKVLFFKEEEGVIYVFTEFIVANIEAAILSNELKIK